MQLFVHVKSADICLETTLMLTSKFLKSDIAYHWGLEYKNKLTDSFFCCFSPIWRLINWNFYSPILLKYYTEKVKHWKGVFNGCSRLWAFFADYFIPKYQSEENLILIILRIVHQYVHIFNIIVYYDVYFKYFCINCQMTVQCTCKLWFSHNK